MEGVEGGEQERSGKRVGKNGSEEEWGEDGGAQRTTAEVEGWKGRDVDEAPRVCDGRKGHLYHRTKRRRERGTLATGKGKEGGFEPLPSWRRGWSVSVVERLRRRGAAAGGCHSNRRTPAWRLFSKTPANPASTSGVFLGGNGRWRLDVLVGEAEAAP